MVFHGYGTMQYRLKQLCNGLKRQLSLFNQKQFNHISTRAKVAKTNLEDMQKSVLQSGIMMDGYRDVKRSNRNIVGSREVFSKG